VQLFRFGRGGQRDRGAARVGGSEGALLDGDIEQAASADDGTDDGGAFQDGAPGNAVIVLAG
jgi:hypothetical protein